MAEKLTIWTYDWVPAGLRGLVRDLRLRWATEEAGLNFPRGHYTDFVSASAGGLQFSIVSPEFRGISDGTGEELRKWLLRARPVRQDPEE